MKCLAILLSSAPLLRFGKGREGQTEDFQIAVLSAHATAPYTQRKERGTPKTSILSG